MAFEVDFVAIGRPYLHFPAIPLLPVLCGHGMLIAMLTANLDGFGEIVDLIGDAEAEGLVECYFCVEGCDVDVGTSFSNVSIGQSPGEWPL